MNGEAHLTLRRLVKTGGACALSWVGADDLLGTVLGSRYRPLVVGYHRVVEDFAEAAGRSIPAMLISRRMLERHLDWIGKRYRYVSLDELGCRLEAGEPFDSPVAAVTFDDGYRDVFENAFPLLKRKGIPAGVFVVTDLVDTTRPQIHDTLYALLSRAYSSWSCVPEGMRRLLEDLRLWPAGTEEEMQRSTGSGPFGLTRLLLEGLSQDGILRVLEALQAEFGLPDAAGKREAPMTWAMLAEMQRAGMSVGSHTKTHPLLTHECGRKVLEEMVESRQALERRLRTGARHIAYPDGRFNTDVVRAAAAAGYRFGYTICRHLDPYLPLLSIPRKVLWENSCLDALGRFSPAILSCQTNGVFDAAETCRVVHA